MTDHDDFDRSLRERLQAHEARVPGASAPNLGAIATSSASRSRGGWGWGALVAGSGVAAGLILVLLFSGRSSPPTGQATATPQSTSSASSAPTPSASTAPSPPSLSSLAGLIAFSRDEDVYTMRPDGSAVTRLTDDPDAAEVPIAWLTDGSRIVVLTTATADPYHSTVSLVSPDGAGTIDLRAIQPYSPPTFSPDSTKIAFGGDGDPAGGNGIAVLDLVDGTLTQLTSDGGHGPIWSPDGMFIAYQAFDGTGNGIRVVALDGSAPVTLAPDPAEDYPIRWTLVDGELKLVFESQRGTDQTKFSARPWIVNADGTDVQLLADSGLDPALAERKPTRVSPDGHWIATACDAGLCLTSTDGADIQLVFEQGAAQDIWSSSPSWSPDAAHLAYADSGGIKVVFLRGGVPVTISAPVWSDSAPVWQPVPR